MDTRVPFEMRMLLAAKPEALSAVGRIFVQEIHRWQRNMALLQTKHKVRCGAVAFPQRFGGSLNLNVHYHVVVPDVVFLTHDGVEPATPLELAPPNHADLEEVVHNTACRVVAWLKRRGHVRQDEDDLHGHDQERSALDACLQSSLGVGLLHPAPSRKKTVTSREPSPPKRPKGNAVAAYAFNLHAGVKVSAGSAEALERLLRYCARAPLSLERLAQPDDDTITYQVKHGNQIRVMTPMQFMARLAALIPPPRHPLIRFHGVFAPHSRFRKQVVPTPAKAREEQPATCRQQDPPQSATPLGAVRNNESLVANTVPNTKAFPARETELISRIDWATLLQRVHTIDALACPECGDRMRFTDLFDQRHLAREELKKRGLPTHAPPLARARSPDSSWD